MPSAKIPLAKIPSTNLSSLCRRKRRYPSAYSFYSLEKQYEIYEKAGGDITIDEISRRISTSWMELSFEERAPWEKKANLHQEALTTVDLTKKTVDDAETKTPAKVVVAKEKKGKRERREKKGKKEKSSKKRSLKRKISQSKNKKLKRQYSKAPKDPSRPKRPITAYLFFAQQMRPRIKAKHPDMKGLDITRQIGQAWNEASAEEKLPYLELEKKSKNVYRKGIDEWRRKKISSSKDSDQEEMCLEIDDVENGGESHVSEETENDSKSQKDDHVGESKVNNSDDTKANALDDNDTNTITQQKPPSRPEDASKENNGQSDDKIDNDEKTESLKIKKKRDSQSKPDKIEQDSKVTTALSTEQKDSSFCQNVINSSQDMQNRFLFSHRLPNGPPFMGTNAMPFNVMGHVPGPIPLAGPLHYGQLSAVPNFFMDQNPPMMNSAYLQLHRQQQQQKKKTSNK